jgi:pimeloyl-ACP methyl ester carboxylesterase
MKKYALAIATALTAMTLAQIVHAQCPSSEPTCSEYTGAGKKGSFFRISVPNSPAWNGDVVLINHGFDLDSFSITGHNTCRLAGNACTVDAECPLSGDVCNKIDYFGFDEELLPQGIAVAASTYSQTGWAAFQSRKDLKDILKFMKKQPGIGKPERVFVTGFSMGGAVTIDFSLRYNPKKIAGIAPLCPAAAGGLPSWDAAMDIRMAYDYVCSGVSGGEFFSPVDQSGDTASYPSETQLGVRFNNCMGTVLGPPDIDQQARLDLFRDLLGHTGTDFEMVVLVGFATQGMYDTVQPKKKLKGKPIAYNPAASVIYPDAGFDAGVQRFEELAKGRKKLNKNYLPDFTRGKGSKITYPIVTLANNDDFLTVPGMQQVYRDALTAGGLAFTQTFVNGGSHCNFSEYEVNATVQSMLDWANTGIQPTETDIESTCLALPGASAPDCDFDIGFVPPDFIDRVPARPDWPEAAK